MTSLAVSTWWRTDAASPTDILGAVEEVGATGLVLDASLVEGHAYHLYDEAMEARIAVPAAVCPFVPAPGRRRPRLATGDREERLAAVNAVRELLRRVTPGFVVIVELGMLPGGDWPRLVRDFARGALRPKDLDAHTRPRLKQSAMALDWSRFALEPLLERAAGAGATIALTNRARIADIPDDMEILALIAEFTGAPLASWLDPAAAHARAAYGGSSELPLLAPLAAGAYLTDAAGLRGGLPWGRGEVEPAVLASLPPAALRVIHCAPQARLAELRAIASKD